MTSDYFENTFRPAARLHILMLLEDAPRYSGNVDMLGRLLAGAGFAMTRARLVEEAEWLAAEGLVEIERPTDSLVMVTATVTGVEVAQGIGTHPGVQRPRPGV